MRCGFLDYNSETTKAVWIFFEVKKKMWMETNLSRRQKNNGMNSSHWMEIQQQRQHVKQLRELCMQRQAFL